MHKIIEEINKENGSNYKLAILKKHKDNPLLPRLLKMTYDKVIFTYGVTLLSLKPPTTEGHDTLDNALNILETKLCTRVVTGNAAIELVQDTLETLSFEDSDILLKVINRSLKINLGRSFINKAFKNLIVKPVYMRCSILTTETKNDVKFPAILNLKADGTYREVTVDGGIVTYNSRSGEIYDHTELTSTFSSYPDGKYICELTVRLDANLIEVLRPKLRKLDKKNDTSLEKDIVADFKAGNLILPRALGNGLIKSKTPPETNLVADCWDYVTLDEYTMAKRKDKKKGKRKIPYIERFDKLKEIIGDGTDQVNVVESVTVNNMGEVMQQTQKWMGMNLEGSILKNNDAIFKDGTSTEQWKIKLNIEADVRVTGFLEGTKGTKREKTFGSVLFETDDGKVKGRTAGFNDALLEDINGRREDFIGTIITVRCNDITKAMGNNFFALSHTRYIEDRPEKTETDTLERILEEKNMVLNGLKY